jgi:catechol 2,3-dioxygenase-like lactoylglutathione lyase family enzyme
VDSREVIVKQQSPEGPLGSGVAVTHILVVADPARSRDFWVDVLGAELYREYGGTSVVLRLFGTWLLLVSGGGPTADKPAVVFAPPADAGRVSHAMTLRVADCQAAYEALRSRGAIFLTPPHDWARRSAAFYETQTVTWWRSASQRRPDRGMSGQCRYWPGTYISACRTKR